MRDRLAAGQGGLASAPSPLAPAEIWDRAARCYQEAGLLLEAARSFRQAGAFRQAADLFRQVDAVHDAADMYVRSGDPELGAWLLVQVAGEAGPARTCLADRPSGAVPPDEREAATRELLRELVEARCALADGTGPAAALALLPRVRAVLADSEIGYDDRVEEWAIAVAYACGRPDQVALLFAAAVRGGRAGAAARWSHWSMEHFGMPIVIPLA